MACFCSYKDSYSADYGYVHVFASLCVYVGEYLPLCVAYAGVFVATPYCTMNLKSSNIYIAYFMPSTVEINSTNIKLPENIILISQ